MNWKRGSLSDFMGSNVVYRNLEPQNPDLAGLSKCWRELGFADATIPRKTSPAYAKAMLRFVAQAQAQRGVSGALERLLFIGDTAMNDGTAALNMAKSLPLRGFIGADRLKAAPQTTTENELMLANRWSALTQFADWAAAEGFSGDDRTALLIDLDKTSLGARGRNDHVIDRARVSAVQRTMQEALGERFDESAFRAVYDPLNQPDYHYFTADNQDYLAYICLMVSGGVYASDQLWPDLAEKRIETLDGFVAACDLRSNEMSEGLRQAHEEVKSGLAVHDPTPFKGFRRGEFFETIAAMNVLGDEATPDDVLDAEIVITAEVASFATAMLQRGVLVFGISDKPDEASVPTEASRAQGYQAIHQATMKIYGEDILNAL